MVDNAMVALNIELKNNQEQPGGLEQLEMEAAQREFGEDEETLIRQLQFIFKTYCVAMFGGALTLILFGLFLYYISPATQVLLAISVTLLFTFVSSFASCIIPLDLTQFKWSLAVIALIWLGLGILYVAVNELVHQPFLSETNRFLLRMLYYVVGSDIFFISLMRDTQMVISGWHTQLTQAEYMIGAIMLYSDVMLIFINVYLIFND